MSRVRLFPPIATGSTSSSIFGTSKRSVSRRSDSKESKQFDEWDLRWAMKKTRESHSLAFATGGATYTEENYATDIEAVRELYLNQGFVDVAFGEPQMEYEDGNSRLMLLWNKPRRWLHLTIPVVEGKQYRVGSVDVEGAEVLPKEFVKNLFQPEGR